MRGYHSFVSVALLTLGLGQYALADCECGYTLNSTTDTALYTDLLETNFLTLTTLPTFTWSPANYTNMPGRITSPSNVIPNPVHPDSPLSGAGIHGGDPGLQLLVRAGGPPSSSGEIQTLRKDILYGSFRTSIKAPTEPGTAAAFFFYHSDESVVDMEFLSRQISANGSQPINLLMHSPESEARGGAQKTNDFELHPLPFVPSMGYHEYRFDWAPGRVDFIVDGTHLRTFTGPNVPSQPGSLLLAHWGSNKVGWTGPPPKKDTTLTVAYVKSFFNSSESDNAARYEERCGRARDGDKVCAIRNQEGAPDGDGNKRGGFFFTEHDGMAQAAAEETADAQASASESAAAAKATGKTSDAGLVRVYGGGALALVAAAAATVAWLV